MSDWSRPGPDGPDDGTRIEIPLTGDAGDPEGPHGPTRPAPNWRRTVGLSVLGGVALGIAVASVVLTTWNDDEQPTETTADLFDPDEDTAAITVPPTLTPVTEPPATLPAVPSASAPPAPAATDADRVAASVATLPPRADSVVVPADAFRLSDGSLAALDAPVARRSVTDYVVGVDGFEQTITITNDPDTGRYLIELDSGGAAVPSFVVDLLGGFTHAETAPGEWASIPNEEVAANAGVPDMATFVRNLQLGPIRSDTRDAWALSVANRLVETDDDGDLREYVVVLDAAAVPEWARYAFGPGSEAAPLPGNTLVGYAVYVAADGSIRRVSGSAEFGATTQRIVHRLEELDDPPVIEIPEAAEIVNPEPAAEATVPPTTSPAG